MDVTSFDRGSLWRFRGWPQRIIDGDTFVAMIDTGFSGRHEGHIRIADLLAPELHQSGGPEAQALLATALISGPREWSLRIVTRQRETVVSEVRSFERWVADVWVVRDGRLVDVKELL